MHRRVVSTGGGASKRFSASKLLLDQLWEFGATCAQRNLNTSSKVPVEAESPEEPVFTAFAVVTKVDRLWTPGDNLTYAFMEKATTIYQSNQQQKVKNAILEWQKYANITFECIDNVETAIVRISFNLRGGSWSFVGTEVNDVEKTEATMNLGWVYGDSTEPTDGERGAILHEFGHTLGLLHEIQSPDRTGKLTLKHDAVIDYYSEALQCTPEEVERQIIDVYNSAEISNYSELDMDSIMMYFMPATLNEEGIRVLPNNSLSATDKAFMIINYPLDDKNLFEEALHTTAVEGESRERILQMYDQMDYVGIRREFSQYCAAARAASKPPVDPNIPDLPGPPVPDACAFDPVMAYWRSSSRSNGINADAPGFLWQPGQEITYSWVQSSTHATAYRKRRVRETFGAYATRVNLSFREVSRDTSADIHVYFGVSPRSAAGWALCGTSAATGKRTAPEVEAFGGTEETSLVLSDDVIFKFEPTSPERKAREERLLTHEIGHVLGLEHEHGIAHQVDDLVSGSSRHDLFFYDEDSIMLYPSPEARFDAEWSLWKDHFNVRSTKYNRKPSKTDLAFLGALYPRPRGHIDDHFENDLADLGIRSMELLIQRDLAFSHYGRAEFSQHIQQLRSQMSQHLDLVRSDPPVIPAKSPIQQHGIINPNSRPTNRSFVDELMKQLSSTFKPTSGQIFALQFPGRFLQSSLYAWDTGRAGIAAQFTKPTVVNENEFRLVDQLYNVGSVISAPNGLNLSIVYEQVLNNLIPGVQLSQVNFTKHQAQIRQWLLKEVPATDWVKNLITSQTSKTSVQSTPTSPKAPFDLPNKLSDADKVNRLELSSALTQEYLSAKQAWELERQSMIENARGDNVDAAVRRLGRITAIREAQLAAKHADAVVRGFSHLIRQYTAYLDIKTPSEMLQDAKDALRESATSSLDGSLKVYPVQMQPVDWFLSLSTNFKVEDLTENPTLYLEQINAKSKQLDALDARLASLSNRPRLQASDLRKAAETARDSLNQANANLASAYSTNVVALARTCINSSNKFVMADFLSCAQVANIADSSFVDIERKMKSLTDAQVDVQRTTRTLTRLEADVSLAEATSAVQEATEIHDQIRRLTKDISTITSRYQALLYSQNPSGATPFAPITPQILSLDQIPLLPFRQDSQEGRWQNFTFNHQIDTLYSFSSENSGASAATTSTSLFFGTHDSDNRSASASSSSTDSVSGIQVEIGFRATLVNVDRSGWFQPQFFKQSSGFHFLNKHASWSRWPSNVKSTNDLTGMGNLSPSEAATACEEINKYLLPAFPAAFVICKDITIKIHLSNTNIQKSSAEMAAFAATSSGVLCFSTNSSDTSATSSGSYGFQAASDGCVIRIAGPQILGYYLQFLDPDTTTEVPDTLPDGFLVSDSDYDSVFK
ncbi:hypothetical protein CPB83DRAFT_763109 [Crepidotus variabilis]|uniref:Peptidase metallopeptidase domain-containing protein n=1 Tax=Crepidotus variabilis TaxID=179855 RepID=A0A9P6JSG8_9AGAR|nr:hypothetical protein CPB83DRAFT_763109 [Crepidotus variabilis]